MRDQDIEDQMRLEVQQSTEMLEAKRRLGLDTVQAKRDLARSLDAFCAWTAERPGMMVERRYGPTSKVA